MSRPAENICKECDNHYSSEIKYKDGKKYLLCKTCSNYWEVSEETMPLRLTDLQIQWIEKRFL